MTEEMLFSIECIGFLASAFMTGKVSIHLYLVVIGGYNYSHG